MRALGGLWHQHSVGSFDKVDGAHISHDLCTGIDLGIELLLDLMDRLYASCQRCLLLPASCWSATYSLIMIHLHLGQFHSSSAVMRSRVLDWQSGTVGSDLPYNIDERQVSRNAEFPRQSGLPNGDVYTLRDLGLLIYQRGVSASLSLRLSKSTNRTTITKQTKSGEITMPREKTLHAGGS
jgi:hypothetical protein